jgi:hypothetical protein
LIWLPKPTIGISCSWKYEKFFSRQENSSSPNLADIKIKIGRMHNIQFILSEGARIGSLAETV